MLSAVFRQLSLDFKKVDSGIKNTTNLGPEDERLVHQKRVSAYLSLLISESVDVVFTDNRVTMLSSKKSSGMYKVRLHFMFAQADDSVLNAISLYVTGVKSLKAAKLIDNFIAANTRKIRSHPKSSRHGRRVFKIAVQGRFFNLADILKKVAEEYFAGEIDDVTIMWGRAVRHGRSRRRTRVYSRALGTYRYSDKSIRISPVLDCEDVPEFFVEWVVYHELLHHLLPVEQKGATRRYHTPLFKEYEQRFARYSDAQLWEKQNIYRLLS
jgi:hypothetical protein